MLIGGAAGGLAGNMMLDRQTEQRRQQEAVSARQTQYQLQLDFERQRALQAEQTRIEIEEQRLFQQWQRERGGTPDDGSRVAVRGVRGHGHPGVKAAAGSLVGGARAERDIVSAGLRPLLAAAWLAASSSSSARS